MDLYGVYPKSHQLLWVLGPTSWVTQGYILTKDEKNSSLDPLIMTAQTLLLQENPTPRIPFGSSHFPKTLYPNATTYRLYEDSF